MMKVNLSMRMIWTGYGACLDEDEKHLKNFKETSKERITVRARYKREDNMTWLNEVLGVG